MTTIALVEDNDDLRWMTCRFLESKGYSVVQAASAEELTELSYMPDIYVVDLNLPETSGYELIRNLRKLSNDVGIIVLSARERTSDVTEGYDAGADVYLVKPVDPQILLAALLRLETRTAAASNAKYALTINKANREIIHDNETVRLSDAENKLLYQFALSGGRGLERWEIAEILGMNLDADIKKALGVRITRLRKKLQRCGTPHTAIIAKRGFGYALTIPICFT